MVKLIRGLNIVSSAQRAMKWVTLRPNNVANLANERASGIIARINLIEGERSSLNRELLDNRWELINHF